MPTLTLLTDNTSITVSLFRLVGIDMAAITARSATQITMSGSPSGATFTLIGTGLTTTIANGREFINAGTVQTIQYRLLDGNFDITNLNMSGSVLGTAMFADFNFDQGAVERLFLGLDYTINGTTGNDTHVPDTEVSEDGVPLILTGNNTYNLFSGNDHVNDAGSGRDTMFGGTGNDTLRGNDGNDSLDGGDNDDTLFGGNGNDTLTAGGGTDQLFGGNDNDLLQIAPALQPGEIFDGGSGNDTLSFAGIDFGSQGGYVVNLQNQTGGFNTPGFDVSVVGIENVIGSEQGDNFNGDTGANRLEGRGGNDTLVGGNGNDTLVGGAGVDRLFGGGDNDLFLGDGLASGERYDGDSGIDTLSFEGIGLGFEVNLIQQFADFRLGSARSIVLDVENVIGGSADDFISGDALANSLDGRQGNDQLNGLGGNDTLIGGSGRDEVSGGDNDDLLVVDTGLDAGEVYHGGDGIDTLSFDGIDFGTLGGFVVNLDVQLGTFNTGSTPVNVIGIENLIGSAQADLLIGDALANRLEGRSGNDTLTGDGGNDTLIGGSGRDELFGGADDDLLVVGDALVTAELFHGGTGIDTLSFEGLNFDHVVNLASGTANAFGAVVSVTEIENVIGGNLTDVIAGNGLANRLEGRGGNDSLTGGLGDDTLIGGADDDDLGIIAQATGLDSIDGGTGIDSVEFASGAGVNAGVDLVLNDYSFDGFGTFGAISGIERVTTGSGDDGVVGNLDTTFVDVGAGDDTVQLATLSTTAIGGEGVDTLTLFSLGSAVTFNLSDATLQTGFENLFLTAFDDTGTGTEEGNQLAGDSGLDTLFGLGGADRLFGGFDSDRLFGGADNDTLFGNDGNDTIDGGAGADTMAGELGNDTYIVDNAGDVVSETSALATEIDTLHSSVTRTLGTNQENLILTGTAAINGTGNTLANQLTGNSGNNLLDGSTGADTMAGGLGNDTYIVDNVGDFVSEASTLATEIDTVQSSVSRTLGTNQENLILTGTAVINGTGNTANNALTGNTGNNLLDGSTGADTMAGGLGNDTYIVDNAGDVVSEASTLATEIDTVQSSVTRTLGTNQENLILNGAAVINGTGNTGNNALTGNTAANIISGGTGADTMAGGLGNDTYIVDNAGDVVSEASTLATEIDTVQSSVTRTLGTNQENLVLTGAAVINGTGNTANNVITGNAAANIISGGTGADTMAGGLGNDTYIVDNAGDFVSEASTLATEIDTVQSSVTRTLGTNQENLVLTGAAVINGTGNTANNVITGNAAANIISGGTGADTMAGGLGNDTYIVDNAGDLVTEASTLATEIDTVQSSVTRTLGTNQENLILTGAAANGTGNTGNNALTGNTAANIISGGTGADTMAGGLGNDTYIVDNVGDFVSEASTLATEIDTVQSSVTRTLGTNQENHILTGAAVINGTGNTANNVITGNAAANVLSGGTGADTMAGGLGNDTYIVDNAGDVVTETSTLATETDTVQSSVTRTLGTNQENLVLTGAAVINGTGNTANNVITGNASANVLNGGTGADTMAGGLGNDTYIVDNAGDVVTEASTLATEIDTVQSSVTRTLGTNQENLILTGAAVINGTGNTANNALTGNTGNNLLDGSTGADTMAGGLGNDTYIVDNAGDLVSEAASAGTDQINSSISRTLPVNVENLVLTGSDPINGSGNTLANKLTGNTGNNVLNGLSGNDSLNGGGGNDTLTAALTTTPLGKNEIDTLTGGLNSDRFVLGIATGRLYDNGVAASPGHTDYTLITDFTPAQFDKLQLKGTAAQYLLGTSPIAGVPGNALYHDTNANGTLQTGTDELIAIIRSPVALTSANTINTAVFI